MKRGELARHSGCNAETIRYYEQIGLLKPARSAAGHRIYSATDRARLGFILRARELGFSIAEIRALCALEQDSPMACERVERIAREHLEEIRRKIADLERLERTLAQTVERCGRGDAPICPVIETLSQPPRAHS